MILGWTVILDSMGTPSPTPSVSEFNLTVNCSPVDGITWNSTKTHVHKNNMSTIEFAAQYYTVE